MRAFDLARERDLEGPADEWFEVCRRGMLGSYRAAWGLGYEAVDVEEGEGDIEVGKEAVEIDSASSRRTMSSNSCCQRGVASKLVEIGCNSHAGGRYWESGNDTNQRFSHLRGYESSLRTDVSSGRGNDHCNEPHRKGTYTPSREHGRAGHENISSEDNDDGMEIDPSLRGLGPNDTETSSYPYSASHRNRHRIIRDEIRRSSSRSTSPPGSTGGLSIRSLGKESAIRGIPGSVSDERSTGVGKAAAGAINGIGSNLSFERSTV